MYEIEWPKWSKLVNEKFLQLVSNRDRLLVLYGGRGSSKSHFAATMLIYRCLTHDYFKCVLYRKNANSIKDSSYETVKQIVEDLGLSELFRFKVNPLEIVCYNGNTFISRGGDDAGKLKSIKDPTCVWYEEDVPTEKDFATISLTLRSTKAEFLQEIFTINPQVEGDPRDNWFWRLFFENETELNFSRKIETEINGETIEYNYTAHHSTYRDNKYLPDVVKAQIEQYKVTNPYLYAVYGQGLWIPKETGGNFWRSFNRGLHSGTYEYNAALPLHLSFDFNVNPYMTCTVYQVEGKSVKCIAEIAAKNPHNTSAGIARLVAHKYRGHTNGVFIYGDCNGFAQDTRSEKGGNDYRIIQSELAAFKPILRVGRSNPSVSMSGQFINEIFAVQSAGISISIDENCGNLLNDLSYTKEAPDGGYHKQKVKDENGVTYEKYGHMGDTLRYFITTAFSADYENYQRGGQSSRPILGKKPINVKTRF